ncbi:hypothetical protein [Christensenella minuta]|uniref:hypothetical protein n=1 Tax=Christensenella minuta TaxID=626937 RepID=UPI0021576F65|nr:hypothetical protein [Christensenella minuta]
MKELKEAVKVLMNEEYERAAKKFGGNFNSPHEVYAVILEEKEEVCWELMDLKYAIDLFWESVKKDDTEHQDSLRNIEKCALNAACECIQIAAMAYKARR